MKIIKYGKPYNTLQTTCRWCECIFEVADNELNIIKDSEIVVLTCPYCGKTTISDIHFIQPTGCSFCMRPSCDGCRWEEKLDGIEYWQNAKK